MTKEAFKRLTGKDATVVQTFESSETFGAYYEAERAAKLAGYSVGRMERDSPIGLKQGHDWDIQKWHNLSQSDRRLLDGVICGDKRNGPVVLIIGGK